MTFKHIENSIRLTHFPSRCGLKPHLRRALGHNFPILRPSYLRCQSQKFQISLLAMSLLCMAVLIDTWASETVADDEISVLAVGDITISSRMTPLIERRVPVYFLREPPP